MKKKRFKHIPLFLFLIMIAEPSCTKIDIEQRTNEDIIEVVPITSFEKDAYHRALMFSSLTWTPKAPIPIRGGAKYFPAGEEREGMLYGESASQDKRVGYDVSLYTFLTAINNPYSLLYTENVNEFYSKSLYGFIYHGDGNSGAYMGVACNTYVYMVLGSLIPFSSYETSGFVEERGIVKRINNNSSQSLRLFDLLQTPGHIRIVTRLWKDELGYIKQIEVSEAVETGVRTVLYDAYSFDNWLSINHYSIFRFETSFSVGDVSQMYFDQRHLQGSIQNSFDICTFAGDSASFGENDLIVINYSKGNFKAIEVFKNEEIIDTITLSEDESLHSIVLSDRGYGYGNYKARLVGNGLSSAFTYWEVLNVNIQSDGDKFFFSSRNATPLYWGWYNASGWACWKQPLSDNDIMTGEFEVTNRNESFPVLKLYVQGQYGRIAAKYIN